MADEIFRRLEDLSADDEGGLVPRLFGGATFEDHSARFVLPSWTYRVDADGRSRVAVAVPADAVSSPHGRRSARRRALDRLMARSERTRDVRPAGRPVLVRPPDAASFRADVEAALRDIAAGGRHKVVAARPFDVSFDGAPSVGDVLHALDDLPRGPGAVRFAFRSGDATFVGLTPERLVVDEMRRGCALRARACCTTRRPGCGRRPGCSTC